MTRTSELFAISTAALLILSFLSRFSANQGGISIQLRNVAYVLPPSTVCLIMASLLCFSAAVYSLWPLPMNLKAGTWHFWSTAVAIAAFSACYYLFALRLEPVAGFESYKKAALLGLFSSLILGALAQIVFVVNLMLAVVRLPHPG